MTLKEQDPGRGVEILNVVPIRLLTLLDYYHLGGCDLLVPVLRSGVFFLTERSSSSSILAWVRQIILARGQVHRRSPYFVGVS